MAGSVFTEHYIELTPEVADSFRSYLEYEEFDWLRTGVVTAYIKPGLKGMVYIHRAKAGLQFAEIDEITNIGDGLERYKVRFKWTIADVMSAEEFARYISEYLIQCDNMMSPYITKIESA